MRIILTGGGTGGHVVPNLAVIAELRKKKGVEILYVGSSDGMERKMVEMDGVAFKGISCGKLRRYFSWQNFVDLFKVPLGILQARGILRQFKPDVVFSKGGYVSLPVVLAARWLKVPVVMHESDVMPGIANKICARFADKILLSFEESAKYFKPRRGVEIAVMGNIVRAEILEGDAESGRSFTGLDKHRPVILAMGGSLGAQQINRLIEESLDELLKRYQIVHVRGRGNLNMGMKRRGYVQYEFLGRELADVYAMSDMLISRGGANSLAEIALLGKKALIIPLGTAGSRGEQAENVRVYMQKFAWSMLSGDVQSAEFIKGVEMAYANELGHAKIKNATPEIAKILMRYK